MDWTNDFQLFLFDFDGLLVNTEQLHYRAYVRMCEERGYELKWDFHEFCNAAHYDSKLIRVRLKESIPQLFEDEPNWSTLYTQKKQIYLKILHEQDIELMPGVEQLLDTLHTSGARNVVVTHSPIEQVEFIRGQHKILQKIENWLTREDYELSKPHPEPYLKAIERFAKPEDQIIGFEDSPRGISSLLGTPAKAILINPQIPERLESFIEQGTITHFTSLAEISRERLVK